MSETAATTAKATPERSPFIFVVCQNGAETATKQEILAHHPNLNLSFSRPGFITFKVDPDKPLPLRFTLKSTLARTYGWSTSKLNGENADELIDQLLTTEHFDAANRVHLWQRDLTLPGKNGFEPGVSELAKAVGAQIDAKSKRPDQVNQYAAADDLVFDIIMVEPDQWWLGFHYAVTPAGRWPGGAPTLDVTKEVFSRAYFKLKEALMWSGIKIKPTDVCAEIGSAPGGACQLLLEHDCEVIGIDSAEMEDEVLENPKFTHIRRRDFEVKKKDFKPVNWLVADMNLDPNGTLERVANICGYEGVHLKGMVLTLKMSDWSYVPKISEMIKQVRELGFQVVKTRQLAFNRREFCLVAIKNKITLRKTKR